MLVPHHFMPSIREDEHATITLPSINGAAYWALAHIAEHLLTIDFIAAEDFFTCLDLAPELDFVCVANTLQFDIGTICARAIHQACRAQQCRCLAICSREEQH